MDCQILFIKKVYIYYKENRRFIDIFIKKPTFCQKEPKPLIYKALSIYAYRLRHVYFAKRRSCITGSPRGIDR